MNLFPIYILDYLVDLQGNKLRPVCPIQILTGAPDYARLVAYGTDCFDSTKLFPDDGRKSFSVQEIDYHIMVTDIFDGTNAVFQKYVHPFDSAPVLFQDGVLRNRKDLPILELFDELDGLPPLGPEYLYAQFIN